jgi:predicted Na+-dependent transporter
MNFPSWCFMSALSKSVCRVLLALAIVLAVAFVLMWVGGYDQWVASTLCGSFLSLGIAAGGHPLLRKWAFTIWIGAAVTVGMAYPTWLIGIGDFKFTRLFVRSYLLGYLVCHLLRLEPNSCRTIALEVGMQNAGLASGIAAAMGKVATLGLAPIVFGPIMNMTASTLANWWRTHPVKTEVKDR